MIKMSAKPHVTGQKTSIKEWNIVLTSSASAVTDTVCTQTDCGEKWA